MTPITYPRPSETTPSTRARRGYTLIELLVVITLILVLLGLTVLFLPSYSSRERIASGSAQLQKFLMIAKQRALLDRSPRGLRLLPDDPIKPRYYSTMVLIEQPDDLSGGLIQSVAGQPNQLQFLAKTGSPYKVGYPHVSEVIDLALVQPGDWIEVNGSGLMRRIINVSSAVVTLQSPLPTPVEQPTPNFRIVRQPRPLGEPPVSLPIDITIDAIDPTQNPLDLMNPRRASYLPPPDNGDNSMDIMFSPSGAVMGNPSSDWYIFWVREKLGDDPYEGEPTLLVLSTRTGQTSGVEVETDRSTVAPAPFTPYRYVK